MFSINRYSYAADFQTYNCNVSEYSATKHSTSYDENGSRACAAANYLNTRVPQYISKGVPSHLNYAGVGYSWTPPGSEA
jgi:hypothetical protein